MNTKGGDRPASPIEASGHRLYSPLQTPQKAFGMGHPQWVKMASGHYAIRQSFSPGIMSQALVVDGPQRIDVEIKDVGLANLNAGSGGRGANRP